MQIDMCGSLWHRISYFGTLCATIGHVSWLKQGIWQAIWSVHVMFDQQNVNLHTTSSLIASCQDFNMFHHPVPSTRFSIVSNHEQRQSPLCTLRRFAASIAAVEPPVDAAPRL